MRGYGADTWCRGSLVTGRLARGKALVIQALFNRTITPQGTLRGGDEERAYGFGVEDYIGEVGYPAALVAMPGALGAELSKEDRATGIVVAATQVHEPNGEDAIDLRVGGTLVDEDEDFAFTMRVSDTSAVLLGGVS